MARSRPRRPVLTECGHGVVPNPCRISVEPFVACQACAKKLMINEGGMVTAIIPREAIPALGGTITLHRDRDGHFVYRAPASAPVVDYR